MEVLIVLIKKSYWNLQKEEEQNTESVIVGVTTRYGGKEPGSPKIDRKTTHRRSKSREKRKSSL
jgi:hypothetical protein